MLRLHKPLNRIIDLAGQNQVLETIHIVGEEVEVGGTTGGGIMGEVSETVLPQAIYE